MSQKKFSYWLEVSANNLSIEYGINDRIAFYDDDGGNHYFEAPIDSYLLKGRNSAYIRFKPKLPKKFDGNEAPPPADLKVGVQVLNIETREVQKLELFKATINPTTNETSIKTSEDQNKMPLFARDLSRMLTRLPSISDQGKANGLQVEFWVEDDLPVPAYLSGELMQKSGQLERRVQQSLQQLLKLFQSRNLEGIVDAYNRSWEHLAKSFDYGSSASDYANGIDFAVDLNNPLYQYSLDFSKSKLRLDGGGRLVGYHPSPLIAKEPDGFVAMEFPVFFMSDPKQGLKVAG